MRILLSAIHRQARKHNLIRVVAAGIGEDIIARAARNLGIDCLSLSGIYGRRISNIFPAYAVAKLLSEKL
jgi:uncharacterized hydantoinase/oxoprolinase family protein